MLPIISLSWFIILTTLPISHATECFPPQTALPILFHCRDLTAAIAQLARRPGENDLKTWGQHLPTTAETQNLPKLYHIIGAVLPTTCAVQVDVDQPDSFAEDSFRQSDVAASAASAARVVDRCLLRQRLVGLDYPSPAGRVYVMIRRINNRVRLELSGAHEVRNVTLPGSAGVLRIVTGHNVIYDASGSRGNSSLSRIDDQ